MKIGDLLDEYKGEYASINVSGISCNLSKLKDGDLFFLHKNDSTYMNFACKKARAIVGEYRFNSSIPLIYAKNTRSAFALASKRFYSNACDKLKVIAITGTNGKTTTSYMLASILKNAGKSVGVIGTNGAVINGRKEETNLTTPDPDDLHQLFYKMLAEKIEFVIIEASAHALALDKLDGIDFLVSAFTNLTQDHLDFFGSMNEYKKAKLKLFERSKNVVVNLGDETGREISKKYDALGYDIDSVIIDEITIVGSKIRVNLDGEEQKFSINLPGKYNIENALCAIYCAKTLAISISDIQKGLSSLNSVDGRFVTIKTKKASVIIDFAHTPDGLSKLLSTVREITTGRVLVVFGCGGNRDKSKRPLMAKSASIADLVFLTSDNPRNENPLDIINDIASGIKETEKDKYYIVLNRLCAIEKAFNSLANGDSLVIAGKGNENFMEINGEKIPYSDEEIVKTLLGEN